MINRELIRAKAIQMLYAYYENGEETFEDAEKEFLFSLDKSYELYQTLLLLMVSLGNIARRVEEVQHSRAMRLGEYYNVPRKFLENRFLSQLRANKQLIRFQEKQNVLWSEEEADFLRRIYSEIKSKPFFQEYLRSDDDDYESDRELWRKIYRHIICNNEELDDILEERSLYWNDDKPVIDTFVLKTIRRFDPKNGAMQPLLPAFKSEDDLRFAHTLYRTTVSNETYFRQLIREQTLNWELERIAMMDLIIMQAALAEITSFPSIPISVSINEYVELAKIYSTPRSGSYINGMLDTIAKRLREEGKIEKTSN